MEQVRVQPLNEQAYTDSFGEFAKRTTEYEGMFALTKKVIGEDSIGKMLSIGAGTGYFDLELFRRLSREPTKYVAIEPTKAHAEQLLSNLSSAKFPHSVHVEAFTTDFECSEQFDLIILPHCMYCIPNAADILKHCSTMLAEGGKLLVYIQTTLDFSDAPFQNHLVTDESLSKIMNDLGMNHTVHYEASHLLLGDSRPSTDVDLMLNFFLMTEIRSLPSPMYDEIYDLLAQKRIKVDGEDGYKLSHPSAVLVHRR